MPPRMVKRGAASAGPKRTARNTRGTSKAQNQPLGAEESVKVEEASIPVVEEVSIPFVEEVKAMEKPVAVKLELEAKPDANGLGPVKSKFCFGHRTLFWMVFKN